jgi:hypothetical protein
MGRMLEIRMLDKTVISSRENERLILTSQNVNSLTISMWVRSIKPCRMREEKRGKAFTKKVKLRARIVVFGLDSYIFCIWSFYGAAFVYAIRLFLFWRRSRR